MVPVALTMRMEYFSIFDGGGGNIWLECSTYMTHLRGKATAT